MEQRGNAAPGAHPHGSGFWCGAGRHLPATGARGSAMGLRQMEDDDQKEKSGSSRKSYCYLDTLLCVRLTFMHI